MKQSIDTQKKSVGSVIFTVTRTMTLVLTVCLFSLSCSKDDDNNDDPAVPKFQLDITGAVTKSVTGDYAYVTFDQYVSPASGETIYGAVISLSSAANELFSIGLTKEGEIKSGNYDITLSFNPFFSSFANYTSDNGATVYGPVSGSMSFSQVSSKHIAGTFNVVVEKAGSTLQIKGSFNAVTP